jgi:hypothetical protein
MCVVDCAFYVHSLTLGTSYDFMTSFPTWPAEIRADLRAGVKAKRNEDWILSKGFLTR